MARELNAEVVMLRGFQEFAVARFKKLEAEVKRLKQLHHDIYEVYAGSEGIPCETASEGYLCSLISKMVTLAAEGKS